MNIKIKEVIAKRLKQILKDKKLSLIEISKKSYLSYDTINDLLNNDNRDVSLSTVINVLLAIDISLKEFFDDKMFENLDD